MGVMCFPWPLRTMSKTEMFLLILSCVVTTDSIGSFRLFSWNSGTLLNCNVTFAAKPRDRILTQMPTPTKRSTFQCGGLCCFFQCVRKFICGKEGFTIQRVHFIQVNVPRTNIHTLVHSYSHSCTHEYNTSSAFFILFSSFSSSSASTLLRMVFAFTLTQAKASRCNFHTNRTLCSVLWDFSFPFSLWNFDWRLSFPAAKLMAVPLFFQLCNSIIVFNAHKSIRLSEEVRSVVFHRAWTFITGKVL